LTARLKKTVLREKMIEDDLSRVEEIATKSTYKLGVGFERCEKKRVRRVLLSLFLAPTTTKNQKHSNQQNPLPIQSKAILQTQERCEERNPQAKR
jgi:hypothetical protein